MKNACSHCENVKQILTSWIGKQGHERCWYYPDLFRELSKVFNLPLSPDPRLPPREEFEKGCRRYQDEEFGETLF